MINGPPQWIAEKAKTERAAIRGWGPTLRLLLLRTTAIVCWGLPPGLALHRWL
jgi:hypothetical protein